MISKVESAYNLLIIGLRGLQCEKKRIGNDRLGIF